ncbi:uncharacterized protein L3040_005508 [Drepanopeziza brunnea f. sp. 'multigermtubi']|uniref:SnoaL-like domain-containing protein n=1 Tax=Marssonina brunnea f. sp. multigermtubi (strain MB_m1) TaxID=1072389 RepID=K1WNE7_MARBU|nr:uncharacterized protein MBM_08078 [Drepanopeziza brunnea f. sp. 'multigermtubi' MB_m1]EKD13877.1 hypothetical protein MBM_08078 [Drepanopeziza brunnea f. sp. 'multigermtubi' MB_m1]KAJ5040949.1 hypothetical protein L3040_005508 [Drepanopeziza brunnea f. sp. 'multigermtubi']
MKSFSKFLSLGLVSLLGLVQSLDMADYSEGPGIDAGFREYLSELYRMTEDPATTTEFTNFFTPDGVLIVRKVVATGSDEIIALKHKLLPTAGNKHWNHRPNVTTVESETDKHKVFHSLGVIEASYDGGSCSQAYYSTRFTINKGADGVLSMKPHSGNLAIYDDYVVEPAVSPTNIPCGTRG